MKAWQGVFTALACAGWLGAAQGTYHSQIVTDYVAPPVAVQPPVVLQPPPGSDPWGPPLPVPPSVRPGQWADVVWKRGPLWLVVETLKAPAQSQLCARWRAPENREDSEECQTLPEGAARLAFRSAYTLTWPKGRYVAELSLRATEDAAGAEKLLAMVSYGAGGLASAAMHSPPPPPPPPPVVPTNQNIPTFPWPPPQPTSKAPIDRALLVRDGDTLGDAANRLTAALARAGYDAGNRSFYSVPGGFALATRMEQIEEDGTPRPVPQRWSTALPPRPLFSLGDFIRALFTAAEGRYRVIVFVITPQAVSTSTTVATEAEVLDWLTGGLAQLPPAIARLQFTDDYQCTALVYEFRKIASEPAPIANPDDAPSAVEQLQRSGITDALEQ